MGMHLSLCRFVLTFFAIFYLASETFAQNADRRPATFNDCVQMCGADYNECWAQNCSGMQDCRLPTIGCPGSQRCISDPNHSGKYSCDGQVTTNTASNVTCQQQMQTAIQKCVDSTEAARNSCDDSQNTGLAQAQQAAVILGQQVSTSLAAACSSMANISQAANAATAAYQMSCSSSVGTCSTDCSAAMSLYNSTKGCSPDGTATNAITQFQSTIKDEQKTCSSFNVKAQQAQQAINNFVQTTMQAKNCDSLTSGTSSVTTELCLQNPSLVGCSAINMDCSNPTMASNKVCVCSKNPNDPTCLATQSAGNMTTSASTTPGVSASSASTDGFGGDLNGTPDIAQGNMPTSGNDPGIDGKQGAGAALGGNSAGDGGSAAKKGGAAGDPAGEVGVNAGFYGAGGGGSFGGSGGGGSGDPLARYAMAAGAAGKKDGVNLRQFLPGGNMDPRARGLAGISGPDGITGPHSDIWQKIQNRYQVVGPSLMP